MFVYISSVISQNENKIVKLHVNVIPPSSVTLRFVVQNMQKDTSVETQCHGEFAAR